MATEYLKYYVQNRRNVNFGNGNNFLARVARETDSAHISVKNHHAGEGAAAPEGARRGRWGRGGVGGKDGQKLSSGSVAGVFDETHC